jgi:MFS family permease
MHQRHIAAPVSAVLEAATQPLLTGFADPVEPTVEENTINWTSVPDVAQRVVRSAKVEPQDEGTLLTLRSRTTIELPFWQWIIAPLVRRSVFRGLEHMAEIIAARATGTTEPKPARRPFWAPPDRMTSAQAVSIATICAVLATTTYGGSLFTHTIDYVARSFDTNDATLGSVLALTRIGTLIGLVGSFLADKRGRRLILAISTAAVLTSAALSALAPNLMTFAALQVISRGFVNLAAVVGFISTTEEASEGGRAYMLAIASIASGAGFALGALLLPLADLAGEAWRALFALNVFGLLMIPAILRNLPETARFSAMAKRPSRESRAPGLQIYGSRFVVVAATGFLISVFAAPASQFTNRYLAAEHGYSGLGILILRFFTQGVPALVAVWVGGRVAESAGRKPVAARATLLMAITTALFFLTSGPVLWVMLLVSTVAGAVSGPSLAAFNTELFPTEFRGRAGGALLVVAVAGSAVGLVIAGSLAEPLGSLGASTAITAIGPFVVALFLIRLLPEARGRLLDELSPPQ